MLAMISELAAAKPLIRKYRMRNLYAILAKILNIRKRVAVNLVNESANMEKKSYDALFWRVAFIS